MSSYFRKSIKIAPGVHINLSKRGTGISFGVRGAHVSLSPTGRVTKTVSLPGTGIYYRDVSTVSSRSKGIPHDAVHPQVRVEDNLPFTPTAHQVVAVEHHGFYISHGVAAFFSIVAAGLVAEAGRNKPLSIWVPILLGVGGISLLLWLRDLVHASNESAGSHE